MSDVSGESHHRPWVGGGLTALAVVLQGVWFAAQFPNAHLDADLLSYLSQFRGLREGTSASFGYTVPKVLPIALLGPTASPALSSAAALAVAALGGAFVFVLATRLCGFWAAVLAALAYVFDPLRCILTVRASADLFVGVGLLGAMLAISYRAVVWAGWAILWAALAKPLALVCGVALLLVPGPGRGRRLLACALPLLALPAAAALDAALDGRDLVDGVLAMRLPDEHAFFVRVAQSAPTTWTDSLHTLFVDWFGSLLFARTWPLLLIGLGLCVGRALLGERTDLRGGVHRSSGPEGFALVLVPLSLVGAYVGLAAVQPFVFFTRFFWVVAATATILVAYAAVAVSSRAPLPRWGRVSLVSVFALALVADRFDDFAWRRPLMLDPFETHARLAEQGVAVLAGDARCAGPAVVPLAYLPLAVWRLPEKHGRGELCAMEDWVAGRGCAGAACVLVMPAAPTTGPAQVASARLLAGDRPVLVQSEQGAVVHTGGVPVSPVRAWPPGDSNAETGDSTAAAGGRPTQTRGRT